MNKVNLENTGSALMVTVFAVAVLAVLTIGILQLNTEELQIARNQIYATQALASAEAGLNDAFAQLRTDPGWSDGFTNKAFEGGTYTVTVSGDFPEFTIISTAVTSESYTAKMEADITMSSVSPYVIRIDNLKVNE